MIYWLLGALIVLIVVAPFFNAWMETRERRREHRAAWEARQRWEPYEHIRMKQTQCRDLRRAEKQLRELGADQAADRFAELIAELVEEVRVETEDLERRSA